MVILREINLKEYPELIRLIKEGEQLSDLLKLSSEELLLRWFNYHLEAAGHPDKVTNFSGDVRDGVKYTVLLNRLNNKLCDKAALDEKDVQVRAVRVLENAKKLGVEHFITSKDIVSGNSKLNTIFTAAIFNTCHGLEPPTKEEAVEAAKLLQDDAEGSREERAFRMWMNSLGLTDVYVNNLYEDVKSGVILLKVIDKIKPGCVEWKKVDQTSMNKFKKIANCNEAVDACKKAGLSIVGVGGIDLHDGNKKLTLGIVWQLMRSHTLQVLGAKTEDDLLRWANEMVAKEPKITSFKDKNLTNSIFFIDLMAAMEPGIVDWEIVMKGNFNIIVR
jgi:plastin-1